MTIGTKTLADRRSAIYAEGREGAMVARVLDDITIAVHYLVMGYIVFGGFLVWRWRRTCRAARDGW